MNNKNYYFSNASVNDRINKEKTNHDNKETCVNIDESKINDFNNIYENCKNLVDEKLSFEITVLFAEELSELTQSILKLERWNYGDEFIRCNYKEIINNIYEELADVIIMALQFAYKNQIDYDKLIDKIAEKILRLYETKFGEE